MKSMKKLILVISILLINACSNDYYPWTASRLPKWVMDSLKDDSKVNVEQVDFGPVNEERPFLWCYKYKDVVIIYDTDKQGHIYKKTVWRK